MNTTLKNYLFSFILLFSSVAWITAQPVRETTLLNRSWRFILGDPAQAAFVHFDDSQWQPVGLPHSFSLPYFMSKDFYTGYGWYRRHLEMDRSDLKGLVFLEFDGVFQEAEIFVNGKKAGNHLGGYTGFQIEITPYLQCGNNLIAIRVNNLWRADIAPRAGEHTFSGGIYRNVRLVRKSHHYIDWCGVGITTPDLEARSGTSTRVKVETDVVNAGKKAVNLRLVTCIFSPHGKVLAKVESDSMLAAGQRLCYSQLTPEIEHPQLWSPTSPTLYKVESKLYMGKQLCDATVETFGFRWVKWTADRGFFLNGNHHYFHGANVHQDQAGWGDAVTEAAQRRDIKMMKEAGFDFIRGSHYPHSPAFSQACDEEGMLFWSEAPFWGIGGYRGDGYWDCSAYPVTPSDTAAFEQSALRQLEEMIRIHRNHPSIVVWSMSNEPFFSESSTLPGVQRLLHRMVERTHQLDPTRLAAIGGAQRPLGENRIDRIGDMAGYNGDGATQPDFQQPGIPSIVAEYGSVTADRPGNYAPGWGDLDANEAWRGVSWRSGQAIWCGFDHGSIAGSALGKMGIVDYFRIPKRAWYWYRRAYRGIEPPVWPIQGKPVALRLEVIGNKEVLADGTDDVQLLVTVVDSTGRDLSNNVPVDLCVTKGPGEFPTGKSICFRANSDIRIQDGKAAISLRAYYSGKCIVEARSPGLKTATVSIDFIGAPAFCPGQSVETVNRPYTSFIRETTASLQRFGRNNPTSSTSHLDGYDAGMATDECDSSFWQAELTDDAPRLTIDTEKMLEVKRLRFVFPPINVNRHFTIEISNDRQHWQSLAKVVLQGEQTIYEWKVDTGTSTPRGRFVSICWDEPETAMVGEVEIYGIVCR